MTYIPVHHRPYRKRRPLFWQAVASDPLSFMALALFIGAILVVCS